MQEIIIKLEKEEETYLKWNIPFNDIKPLETNSIFLYIKNEGAEDIIIDALSISSSRDIVNVQVHSVIGEPAFLRNDKLTFSSKVLGRHSVPPEVLATSCASAQDLGSVGQLDRVDMREKSTTYKTSLGITIPQESAMVLTCSEGELQLSGILSISRKIIEE